MKRALITGVAGFIGSHLADALVEKYDGINLTGIDNYSSGKPEFIKHHEDKGRLVVYKFSLESGLIPYALFHEDCAFHLAANPDARRGITNTRLDLELETIATYNVLESMRKAGVKRIVFASSGTVYGNTTEICVEGKGERHPISLYGAGKVASEALISAYCGTFGMSAVILRFGNVVGERMTHGCIYDFYNQLVEHPEYLNVLGDGSQSKPYIYVEDIAAALAFAGEMVMKSQPTVCDVFNVAPETTSTVSWIARTLLKEMNLAHKTKIIFGETKSGWAGDVPQCRMNSDKLSKAGFNINRTSDEAVDLAIAKYIEQHKT